MHSLRDTLVSLHLKKFTGRIVLRKDQVAKTVYFKKGTPIFVDSNMRSETLGQILLTTGKITQEQYCAILERMNETGRRQGETIVEMGVLTGFEVFEHLKTQLGRKIENCFLLDGADVEVTEGEAAIEGVPDLGVGFFRIFADSLYGSVTGLEEGKFSDTKAFRLTDEGRAYLNDVALRPMETKILRYLDGKFSMRRVLSVTQSDPDELGAFFAALTALKLVDAVDVARAAEGAFEAPGSEREQAAAQAPKPRVIEIKEEVQPPDRKAAALYEFALMADRPYHELLHLGPQVTKFHVKKAYDAILRRLNLDEIAQRYEGADRDMAEKVFDRLNLAYTVLSDDRRRHEYFNNLPAKRGIPEHPSAQIQAEACAQKARVFSGKRRFAEAEEQLRKAVELDPKQSSYHVELADLFIRKAAADKTPYPETIEEELKEALKLDSSDVNALFQFGLICKLRERVDQARTYFQKVLDVVPNHAQASAELRLINRRAEARKKGESAFSKLFKKKEGKEEG